jgi:hypothetical protein
LWQALSGRVYDPHLIDLWLQRQTDVRAAPPPVRAALINGFQRLCDLQLLPEDCEPQAADLVTLPRTSLEPALITLAGNMTVHEIDHVSRADYGYKADRHREALVTLLANPAIAYPPGEYWFPAEVVELVSHGPKSTGYIPCMAIVLLDAVRDGDRMDHASFRLEKQWAEIVALPQRARDAFFATFRHIYESNPVWSSRVPATFTLPWVENIGPAPAKEQPQEAISGPSVRHAGPTRGRRRDPRLDEHRPALDLDLLHLAVHRHPQVHRPGLLRPRRSLSHQRGLQRCQRRLRGRKTLQPLRQMRDEPPFGGR